MHRNLQTRLISIESKKIVVVAVVVIGFVVVVAHVVVVVVIIPVPLKFGWNQVINRWDVVDVVVVSVFVFVVVFCVPYTEKILPFMAKCWILI